MTYFQSIILGFVQGAAEFLPISSSGHLGLLQNWFGLSADAENLLVFNILLHLGTLISVLIIFGRDFLGMTVAFFKILWELITRGKVDMGKSEYRRLTLMLIIASLPLVLGALIQHYIEAAFQSSLFIGIALLLTGTILILTDKFKRGNKTLENAKFKDALVVGLSQLAALFPGISRSGTTIFGGVAMGLTREFAVRFSFLLSAVAILGATAFSAKDLLGGTFIVPWGPTLAGMLTAMLVGILAIKWLVKLISKGKYSWLSIYCYIMGVIAICTAF